MKDEDFVVCGYILKENNMTSLVIAQYNEENELIYNGHVTLGASLRKLNQYKYKKVGLPLKMYLLDMAMIMRLDRTKPCMYCGRHAKRQRSTKTTGIKRNKRR